MGDTALVAAKLLSVAFRCHEKTVSCVRRRYVEQGLTAALERKKQLTLSRKRILDGEGEARLLAIACRGVPEGRAKWTLLMLADELVALNIVDSISQQTVHRVLKKTNSDHICTRCG